MNLAQVGFGRVWHARMRPRRHAFGYPGFFLMLPMRSLAAGEGAAALAVNRAGAISFHDRDHGDGRGPDQGGALAWCDAVLRQHGIHDALGETWLQTYPRMFGYTFKPVSFWYCHRADGSLGAVIAEVNNTFGERHCYLLDAPRFGTAVLADKVFHVSPFCRVAGRYRFRFDRSTAGGRDCLVVRVDLEDGQGPLLRTCLSGHLEPASAGALRRALWKYPAMTLTNIARIHWQALRLWGIRTPFFRKPAAPAGLVSR
jgi:DUF1365 family protein